MKTSDASSGRPQPKRDVHLGDPTSASWPVRLERSGVLAFALLMLVFSIDSRWSQIGAFDPDEGVNVIKGYLVFRGLPLYSEVWSDQPPMLTWMLAGAFQLFGSSLQLARVNSRYGRRAVRC